MARAPDRRPVLWAALREGTRAGLATGRRWLRGPARTLVPDRILFAPRDLRAADPAVAEDMAAGLYVFGDRTLRIGRRSPFAEAAPSRDWAEDLYGFGWLRHLRAADTAEARALARALVLDALGPRRRDLDRGPAGAPKVVARRVGSLLAHSPLLLTGADPVLYRRYLATLGRDAATLRRAMREAAVPADRLAAAIGLCVASLACEGLENRLKGATRAISRELDAQILADGGHVGRNPGILLDLLLDLLPLRLLYASRALAVPPALDRAVDRMLPMLRFFRHGSGDLALFNGMGGTPASDLVNVLLQDDDRGAPALHAIPSGYDRLEAGATLVLVETGAAPPLAASAGAHAGGLSFELSHGTSRLVVNCGAPPHRGPLRDVARLTAAHSTLVLGGEASGTVVRGVPAAGEGWAERYLRARLGPVLLAGPGAAGAERGSDEMGASILSGHHDGYAGRLGAIHSRRLRLSQDGTEVEGEDTVAVSARGEGAGDATLRFHLHPSVKAAVDEDGAIRILGSEGDLWRFECEGGAAAPSLEESVFFAVPEARRPTRQVVVVLPPVRGGERVAARWRFRRERG